MQGALVVGAGPAGLYAAQLLAGAGLRVLVLEEHDRVGEPAHCTGILGQEAFALPGVPAEAVVARPHVARFHSPAGHCLDYAGPADEVCVVDRPVFDRALAARAEAAGATIRTGHRVVGLRVEPEAVTVAVQAEAKDEAQAIELRASVCLLACGASYRFQRDLGWGVPPLFLASMQTEVPAGAADGLDVFLREDLGTIGFGWRVPFVRHGTPRAKVGVMGRRAVSAVLAQVLADLGVPPAPAPAAVSRLLPLGPLARTHGDRVLAIGDAAGLVKPTTGGGIYYSLLSAAWAAEAVRLAFECGDFSAATLSRYEEAWRERLGAELWVAGWFRRLAARLTPGDLDALTELAIRDGVVPVVRRTARFNWHRDLILATLRHPGVAQIVLGRLVTSGWKRHAEARG